MKAIQIKQYGGAEVLTLQDVAIGKPGAGQVLVRNAAAGVNYMDIYVRMGAFPIPVPLVPGIEGSGVVEAVGDGVTEAAVGDRVAFLSMGGVQPGGYAEACLVPAKDVVRLPDSVSFEQGAALLAQGLTAHYLLHEFRQIKSGDTVLVHAASGGVGLLLVQWARHLGARVIGTVSTQQKADAARAAGAHEVINYSQQNFATEVQRITNGQGAHLILDAVGKTTFPGDMEAAAVRGHIVIYGANSGPVDPISPNALQARSLSVSSSGLPAYLQTRDEFLRRANAAIAGVQQGWLKLRIEALPLARAADAQRSMESRSSIGKLVLTTGQRP